MSSKYAVFGNPILHSKSPQIFNSFFIERQINAFYTRILPFNSSDIVKIIRKNKILGANITTPFKEKVNHDIDDWNTEAQIINGINTIVNENGSLIGHNTDHLGAVRAIQMAGYSISGSKCLVIGAGPAGRAAAYGMYKNGAKVCMTNRTFDKAERFIYTLQGDAIKMDKVNDVIQDFNYIILTTAPNVNPLRYCNINQSSVLLDANYHSTLANKISESIKFQYIGGEQWLLAQAQAAIEIFFNISVDLQVLNKKLNTSLDLKHLYSVHLKENEEIDSFQNIDLIIGGEECFMKCYNELLNKEIKFFLNT